MLLYRSYTNGHSADTSSVWAAAFKNLVETGLVPAVLLPEGTPSPKAFDFVRHCVGTKLLVATAMCADAV